MCSGTNRLVRGEARGPYGPRPHPPRPRERAGEVARRGGTTAGAGGRTSKKPESVTLPGFSWRSEISHAETSQVKENIIGYRRRVKPRPHAGVLVAGFEPTRACAQRLERSPRLPVSPHQHLVGYEPRQSRRPRREIPHGLPPAGPQYKRTRTSPVPRTHEPDHKRALLTPGASPGSRLLACACC